MKKIPLKAWVMLALAIVFAVISVVLGVKIITNHSFVKAYNDGDYLTDKEESLLVMNAPESYLPYYNLGNVAFEKRDYNSAIGYYTKALSLLPTGHKECQVRINLALAMCYSIDFEHLQSQEKVDSALVILYKAKEILLQNGWAKDEPEVGRDPEAQQLKEDIDRMIEALKNSQGDSQNDDNQNQQQDQQDQNSGDEQEDTGGSDKEKKMQEKLEKNKKDAMEERKQTQDDYDKWSDHGDGGSESDGSTGGGGVQHPW